MFLIDGIYNYENHLCTVINKYDESLWIVYYSVTVIKDHDQGSLQREAII